MHRPYWLFRCVLTLVLFLMLPLTPNTQAAESGLPALHFTTAFPHWVRPAVAIPELPSAPRMDGRSGDPAWKTAAPIALRYPLTSSAAIEPDTTCRLGHHGGKLYVRMEIQGAKGGALRSTLEFGYSVFMPWRKTGRLGGNFVLSLALGSGRVMT